MAVAKLVPIRCPTCGADITVGNQQAVVTCSYCQTSCQVTRPGKPPPPPPPPPMGQPMPMQPMRVVELPRTSNAGSVIVIAGLVMTLGIAGAVVAALGSSASMVGSSADDSEVGSRSGGSKKSKGRKSKIANPVVAKNLKKVDPADVIRQAVKQAKKVEKQGKMTGGHFTELSGGLMNLKGKSKGFVTFEYRWSDPSKPAGKDVVEGSFYINSDSKGFNVWAHHKNRGTASNLRDPKRAKAYPVPIPTCTAAQAWAVAVKSGVPADAVSTVHWGKVHSFKSDQKMQWSFRVEGHDEYRREIDAKDCKLLRNWAKRR
ncbi:MAG: hypothetical protein DRI90_05210 [Deltaproteobacteria bacterium]|nr:MAG: hypothetical protein DRI90_05210 [Deltaproteobacteria bacterium]